MELVIRTGKVAGREHIVYGINCQDSLSVKSFEHEGLTYHIGVVSDGCGEGNRSETGSHLATSFLVHKMEKLIKDGCKVKSVPEKLFQKLLEFLKYILDAVEMWDSPTEEVDFIKNHLLFTVLGFVIGPKDTVIFAAGDGVVLLNELLDIRDQQNTPAYPSYHLVNSKYITRSRSSLPVKFDTYEIETEKLQRLAVGTDSWQNELGPLFSLFNKDEKVNPQRLMNVLSQKEKKFKDDAAIITVTRSE